MTSSALVLDGGEHGVDAARWGVIEADGPDVECALSTVYTYKPAISTGNHDLTMKQLENVQRIHWSDSGLDDDHEKGSTNQRMQRGGVQAKVLHSLTSGICGSTLAS
jgi:hypothetical protein